MTVVPGRLGFGFWASLGPTTAALGPPTAVGAVCSLQAAKSAVSAKVVIKRRYIGILPSGISSTHANLSPPFCPSRLSINLWPRRGLEMQLGYSVFLLLSYRRRCPTLPSRRGGHAAHSRLTALAMKASSESPPHNDCEARLIVENMPGFAWSAGQDGKLRYVNQRFADYTGKRIEDFNRGPSVASFGRTDVLHPDDVADTLNAVSHSVATGDPYVVEHRVRRFDGTYRWFRVSAMRIRDLHS